MLVRYTKNVSNEKWFKYYIFSEYMFRQKFFNTLRPRGKKFKACLANLYCTNYNKINIFFEMYNSMFLVQGHTKDFRYIMGYASKRLEMYFQFCTMVFNTFQQCWKRFMLSVCLSVRPSVHALTVVNILQISLNLYMLFISDIE